MSDPSILFVKPKAIKNADKQALHKAGVIVIEIDNPADAKFVRASAELSSTQILMCAISAIKDAYYDTTRVAFANAICAAIELSSKDSTDA